MKQIRTLLSLALALVMVFSLGTGVLAAETYPANTFSDVPRTEWFAEAVDFAQATGLMNGVGSNRFDPYGSVTRAMVATVLYRMEGEPSVDGITNPFTDVSAGSWYYEAVLWASKTGVTNGTSPTTFAPNNPITREQMATMIMRYSLSDSGDENPLNTLDQIDPKGQLALSMLKNGADPKLVDLSAFPKGESFRGFSDADAVSDYARYNVLFCALLGIMNGDRAGTFRPQSTLSRAECAQTFLNYVSIEAPAR